MAKNFLPQQMGLQAEKGWLIRVVTNGQALNDSQFLSNNDVINYPLLKQFLSLVNLLLPPLSLKRDFINIR